MVTRGCEMRGALLALVLAAAAPALAQEDYRHGRLRYVETGVTIQRLGESAADEAIANLPFIPGDRLWTDASGRAELQFAGGGILRVDRGSKLDYVSHDDERGSDRFVLRLHAGSLYLHTRERRDFGDFEIETPGGLVVPLERGIFRVDVDAGETRLSVLSGAATLDSGRRRVTLEAGERSYARRGESPEEARSFDWRAADDFGRWDEERQGQVAWAGASSRYLPEEMAPYAGELDSHGSWYYETEVGHVWRPYVAAGWQPYYDGRWMFTVY